MFDESQVLETTNHITYTFQNFIADIGGLAGLFIGFSLLSLFEIILRIFAFIKKQGIKVRSKRKKSKQFQISPKNQNFVIEIPTTPHFDSQKDNKTAEFYTKKIPSLMDFSSSKNIINISHTQNFQRILYEELNTKYFEEKY